MYDFFGYLLPGFTFGILFLNSGDLVLMFDKLVVSYGGQSEKLLYKPVMPQILEMINHSLFLGILITIVGAYIAGHILSSLSSLFLERLVVERIFKFPADNLFRRSNKPMSIWKRYWFPKYRRPYNADFQKIFLATFTKRFNIEQPQAHEIFWLSFEEISLRAPAAFARSTHFLNLYGFSRAMAMAFLLAAICLSLISTLSDFSLPPLLVISYLILSFLMFWNYLKLLRRLNDEVFRAFYTISTSSHDV